jgi:hypothetical protein
MLSERFRVLLTSYVDGELNARQRRHIEKLLRRSEPARQLLQQLQEDASALKQLPRPPIPFDFSAAILQTIAERKLTPIRRRQPLRLSGGVPAWTGIAAAAAVLLVVGVASYLYFAAAVQPNPNNPVVQNDGNLQPSKDQGNRKDGNPSPDSQNVVEGPRKPDPEQKSDPDQSNKGDPETIVVNPNDSPNRTDPEKPKEPVGPVLTDKSMEMFNPGMAAVFLPVILPLHDLDAEGVRQKLLTELGKESAFRLELPCHDGTSAFDRLQAVCKGRNIGLHIDQVAQIRLKNPKLKTNYVLYIEDLTAEQLAGLLQQLGEADKKALARKPPEAQFDRLIVTRMSKSDRKELSDLLGIDPVQVQPKASGPLGTDLRKPLADQTADQVALALVGQGGTPRPASNVPAVKPPDLWALALAYNPVRPLKGSAEVKRFLDGRKPARPGTMQVLLVLRGTSN